MYVWWYIKGFNWVECFKSEWGDQIRIYIYIYIYIYITNKIFIILEVN